MTTNRKKEATTEKQETNMASTEFFLDSQAPVYELGFRMLSTKPLLSFVYCTKLTVHLPTQWAATP